MSRRVGEAGTLYIKIGKVTDVLYVDPPDVLIVARFDFLHAEIGLSNLTASIEECSDAIGRILLHDSVE